jgi:anthranilate phosphoribosyltransferase
MFYRSRVLEMLTQQLADRQSLSGPDVARAVEALTRPDVAAEMKAEFLTALARKGEVVSEIAAFARELRAKSLAPPLDAETRSRQILDVCGTGGDRLNTFNISTTVALIVASAGVTVAKHGNRAITSQAGSADVLEALGIRIDLEPEEAARGLREHHFAFFFAPKYHPAFREIAPARKLCAARGQRTIFNFLGPLLNPAHPAAQLIGVPRPELCQPIAAVLQMLGARRGMVVSGAVLAGGVVCHLDELSTLGESCVAEFYQERGFCVSMLSPRNFPVQPSALADLAGSDRQANAEIVRRLLRGEDRGPKRDAVLLNSAAALFVAEKAASLTEGWELAGELMDSGRALGKLEQLARVWK